MQIKHKWATKGPGAQMQPSDRTFIVPVLVHFEPAGAVLGWNPNSGSSSGTVTSSVGVSNSPTFGSV